MGMIRLDVTESYYGDGVKRRDGKLEVLVLVDPVLKAGLYQRKPPIHKLVLDVQLPVYGRMVVETLRSHMVDEYLSLDDPRAHPIGPPEWVTRLTFDPQGDTWQGNLVGRWPVKKLRIRPGRTIWQRLQR